MRYLSETLDVPSSTPPVEENHSSEEVKTFKPVERGHIDPHLVCLTRPQSVMAESYSRLRLAVERMHRSDQGFVVSVTSPGDGDGKTLTSINLAGALAQDSKARVLLLDLVLREGGSHIRDYLKLATLSGKGVADWIGNKDIGTEELIDFLPGFNLHLISSGGSADLPYELLKSPRLDELFNQLRKRYDYIVVDTPKVLKLPDTELIARLVDGFLIVVKANHTHRNTLEETLNIMTKDKVLGLVFNAATDKL